MPEDIRFQILYRLFFRSYERLDGQKMGTAIYQQAQAQQASTPSGSADGSGEAPADDEVVEAEIVDDENTREGGAA